jgi:hypothetical protein
MIGSFKVGFITNFNVFPIHDIIDLSIK